MAGFNQRGPYEEGSMTGKGLGKCAPQQLDEQVSGVKMATRQRPCRMRMRRHRGGGMQEMNESTLRFRGPRSR